jgi:hypothetical protein
MSEQAYAGQELELFKSAVNWKAYFHARLAKYVSGDVLEVGAGIGGTTRVLCDGNQSSWVCLEPDPQLAAQIVEASASAPYPVEPEIVVGTLDALKDERLFDTILYIDVLEHIEQDQAELELARERLREGGAIIVLSPAFNFLYSEFDKSVGHFRRYDKPSLKAVIPEGLRAERIFYLDSLGMLASLANRCLLRQGNPGEGQILFWDRYIVRVSRWTDRLVNFMFGRSIVAILRKQRPA